MSGLDTGRRCPRCDCPDGHTQCDHCKVCPHADEQIRQPEFLVALREDDGTLIVGIRPSGHITTGPRYQPDPAARAFWDAVSRAAQSASPIPLSKEQQA
jgi:hypothetical protein